MHLIMLLEQAMTPIPENIDLVQTFGEEHILIDPEDKSIPDALRGPSVRGTSILVTGEPEAFQEWLKPFPGFWISNNPMLGKWKVVHVKDACKQQETAA
jgi:hypothetical protein